MSGNLWMFSDKLDDEDIEIMKRNCRQHFLQRRCCLRILLCSEL